MPRPVDGRRPLDREGCMNEPRPRIKILHAVRSGDLADVSDLCSALGRRRRVRSGSMSRGARTRGQIVALTGALEGPGAGSRPAVRAGLWAQMCGQRQDRLYAHKPLKILNEIKTYRDFSDFLGLVKGLDR